VVMMIRPKCIAGSSEGFPSHTLFSTSGYTRLISYLYRSSFPSAAVGAEAMREGIYEIAEDEPSFSRSLFLIPQKDILVSFVTEGEASLHFSIQNGLPAGAVKVL
jgi:hypothetical protein